MLSVKPFNIWDQFCNVCFKAKRGNMQICGVPEFWHMRISKLVLRAQSQGFCCYFLVKPFLKSPLTSLSLYFASTKFRGEGEGNLILYNINKIRKIKLYSRGPNYPLPLNSSKSRLCSRQTFHMLVLCNCL